MPEPYGWTWTDDDGIRRQMKVHQTYDHRDVVWAPRCVGDAFPWFDPDCDDADPDGRFEDSDLATLGTPVASWSGFDN